MTWNLFNSFPPFNKAKKMNENLYISVFPLQMIYQSRWHSDSVLMANLMSALRFNDPRLPQLFHTSIVCLQLKSAINQH